MSKFLKVTLMAMLLPMAALLYSVAGAEPQFQDDFTGSTLGAGWTTWDGYALENPGDVANRATIQATGEGHLSIAFPGGVEHNQWILRHAQVTRPHLGSGVYEIKVDNPMAGDQQFGLTFEKSPGTFMHFMFYSNANRVYAYLERFTLVGAQQQRETLYGVELPLTVPSAGPHHMRVVLLDNANPALRNWKFDWSADGSNWIEITSGIFETSAPAENIGAIQRVGLFAGNQPAAFSALDARFDHFRYYNSLANVPLASPGNLRAVASDGRVDLAWDAVSLATSFNVYSVPVSGSPTLLGSTSQLNFTQTGLPNGTTQRFAVAAVRAGVEGPSSQVSAVPHVNPFAGLPQQGLQVALTASELAYTLASGAAVSTWPNAAGPAIAATGLGSQRPTLIHSALNGQAVLRFDGVDDHLSLPSGFQDFTAGMSLYVVKRPSALTYGYKVLALGNGAGQHNIVLGRAADSAGLQFFTTNASGEYAWFNTPGGLTAGEASLMTVTQNAGAAGSLSLAEVAKNGNPLFAQQVFVPPVTVRSVNYIGKSYWSDGMFNGDIAEVILYNRKLSSSEHASVQTYLANKYGLSLGGSTPTLAAPGGLAATAGNGSVALGWAAVGNATGYHVLRATTSGGPYTQIASPTGTSHSDTGLTNGTPYHYVVRAFNATLESGNSSQVSATPTLSSLASPTGVASTAGNGSVSLNWSAVSGATGYRVLRATTSGGPYAQIATPSGTSHSDTGLTNGTAYYYVLRAFNATLESPNSLQVSATPSVPVPEPNAALPASGRFLVLDAATAALQFANGAAVTSWQDISGNTRHATGSAGTAPVLVTNALNGQAVLRFDGVDDHLSLPSGFQDFTAGMSLYVVKRPSALTYGYKVLALGNGAGQHNIVFGRATDSTGLQFFTTNASGEYAWFNTPGGLTAGEASLMTVTQNAGAAGGLSLAEVAKNGNPLFAQQVFVPPVTVRSVNYIGKSYWSDGMFNGDIAEVILYNRKLSASEHASVQTYLANKYGLSLGGTTPTLAAPGGLAATAGNSSVALSWAAVGNATGYHVLRATTSGGPYTQIASPTGTSHSDTGVTNGTTYHYVVRAFNATLESGNSTQVSATPTLSSLASPTGVASTAGNGSVALNWSAVSGATGYRVLRATTSGGPYAQIATPSGTSHSDTGLTNGTAYYYVLRAFNATLESPNSLQVSATPSVPVPEPNAALPASGRFLVLDAATAALQFANGAAVTSWQDISGNTRHATGSAGTAPVLVTNALNGQAVLRFDGVDDHLSLPSGFQDFTAGMSLYVVKRPSALTYGYKVLALGNGAGQHNIVLGRAADSAGLQFFTTNASGEYAWFNTPGGLTAGEASLMTVMQDGGAAGALSLAEVAKNGNPLFAQQVFVPPVTVRSVNYIGKSYWSDGMFNGDIAEVILYNRKLSSSEHASVKAYLAAKYGLAIN